MLKAPPFAMTEDGIPNSESFIYSHLPATCGIRSPLCRSLNNLHLHLSLGMPNSGSFIHSCLPPAVCIRTPLCRSLNNLHLHLSLGMPGFISPEFLVEDVSVY